MDGTVDVVVDAAQAADVEDIKATTNPTDGGEVVELMRVHDRFSASTEASTARPMLTVCT